MQPRWTCCVSPHWGRGDRGDLDILSHPYDLGGDPHGHPGVLPAARMAKDRWAMASLMAAPSCLPLRMARARQRQWLCSSFLSSSWKMSRIGRRQEESPILISLFSSLKVGEERAVEKESNEIWGFVWDHCALPHLPRLSLGFQPAQDHKSPWFVSSAGPGVNAAWRKWEFLPFLTTTAAVEIILGKYLVLPALFWATSAPHWQWSVFINTGWLPKKRECSCGTQGLQWPFWLENQTQWINGKLGKYCNLFLVLLLGTWEKHGFKPTNYYPPGKESCLTFGIFASASTFFTAFPMKMSQKMAFTVLSSGWIFKSKAEKPGQK